MDDLMFSLNAVLPLLIMMGVGFAARRLGWMDDGSVRHTNACVFHIFLPLLLYFNIRDTSVGAEIDVMTLVYALATTLLAFGLMFWLSPKFTEDRRSRGVLIQGVCRSNYAIFGIPLVLAMYPSGDTSIAVLLVAVVVPVFNVMSTIALMVYSDDHRGGIWEIVRGILLNPLIIATVLGLAAWQLNLTLPSLLDSPLRQLSRIATPLALFLLGASLDFQKAKANLRLLTLGVLGKLVVVPIVFLTIAVIIGIRDISLAALIAVYASPVAVGSFPMAQQMGGNDDLAGGMVVFTTVLSTVTVFLWVLALRAMGFLG